MAENNGVPFVPFVVEESDVAVMRKFIDEIPTKYGLQVLIWMDQLENRALAAQAKASAAVSQPVPAVSSGPD